MDNIIYEGEIAKKTKFEGYYATKTGKIITVKIKGGQGRLDYNKPRLHNEKVDKDGYLEICFSMVINGKQKRIYRRKHRVIWETFNGDIPKGMTIDHIDFDKTNNDISNLRLLSLEDNAKRHEVPNTKGRNHYNLYINEILVEEDVDRFLLEDKYNISLYQINKNNSGKIPKSFIERNIVVEKCRGHRKDS